MYGSTRMQMDSTHMWGNILSVAQLQANSLRPTSDAALTVHLLLTEFFMHGNCHQTPLTSSAPDTVSSMTYALRYTTESKQAEWWEESMDR